MQQPESRSDLSLTRGMLRYLAAHKRLFIAALCLYPIDAFTVVLPPYLVQRILDDAVVDRDTKLLYMLAAAYLGALLLEYVSGFLSQMAMGILGQRAMRSLRTDLFAKVHKLPASYYDVNPIGRILTRLTNDVEALGEAFATGAVTVIADIITIIAVVGMMLWLDVKLTLFSFLVVPPLVGLAWFFQRFARKAFVDIRKHIARINAYLAEHIGSMSVVQIFRQEERTQKEFTDLNIDFRDANRRAILFDALLFSVVEAIGTTAVAGMVWYGSGDLATGAVKAGTLVAFIQYIRRFFVPIRDLSTKYTVLQSAYASAERIFALLDEPEVITSPKEPKPIARITDGVEFRNVWFSYRADPGDNDWILRDFNLRVRHGERVALVGSTGSGKTTILKLLNRFYDVQRGSILVDGQDVREYDVEALRRLYAVVLQDVYLFSGTIMDNLAISKSVQPEDVERAIKAIHAESFISRLPRGYQTTVQELGNNFSAGEKQLLALARALALNPEVLVLDEATSNIDSETEARIQSALDVVMSNRSAIIVAHRLSTIRKVDRIVVLQRGSVIEEGSHDALMRKGGMYRKLVEYQFNQDAQQNVVSAS